MGRVAEGDEVMTRGRPRGSRDLLGPARRAVRSYRSRQWRAFCQDLGNRLRTARRERAVAAEELASAISVSTMTVLAWERGRSAPAMLSLHAIGRALGCSLVDLLPESARYP